MLALNVATANAEGIPLPPKIQAVAEAEAEANGVPLSLVLAVMEQESRFTVDAEGGDSFGLMQINRVHGPREIIIQPEENIKIGCWLLGYLYREYGDWNMALVAYNCGQAQAYESFFRYGEYASAYSREVMERNARWERILEGSEKCGY